MTDTAILGSDKVTRQHTALWAVVLAAGDGTRLRGLTRALYGEDLPKQFARIAGGDSLLQATLRRTSLVAPTERTVVVIAKGRERIAKRQLQPFAGADLVVQPRNVGTGPGILLPLSRVLARDPHAIVAIFPSDHYVRDAQTFADAVRRAEKVARRDHAVVLLAAEPDGAGPDYGWIEARPLDDGGFAVERFAEKPGTSTATELYRRGALWNTFVMIGPATALWELGRKELPVQTALLDVYRRSIGTPYELALLHSVYDNMPPADFSRDILQRANHLRVLRLPPCGWSDWGTPERIFESLKGTVDHHTLVERLRRSGATATAGLPRETHAFTAQAEVA